MAVEGLVFTTWFGWIFGTLLLNHPWGTPSFTSWFSFSTINSIFGLVVYIIIAVDFFTNNFKGLFLSDNQIFGKWVRALTVIHAVSTNLLKRVSFIVQAKKLGKVMKMVSDYRDKKGKKRHPCGFSLRWEGLLINFAFLLTFTSTFLRGVNFMRENSSSPSWFSVLGNWGYTIVYYVFAIIPLSFVTTCAFAVILVISLRVTDIFCDFCTETKELLPRVISSMQHSSYDDDRHNQREIFNILQMSKKISSSRQHKVAPLSASTTSIISKSTQPSKMDIIRRFEEIREAMKLTNEALSPLLLWLIVGITLGLVTTASHMFVTGVFDINFISDIFFLIEIVVYSTLLQAGYKIREMQRKTKLALHREFLNMPWTPGKYEIEDVIQEILNWEWKLSACGFFNLDRRLASGIFSLVLNYVVIFVQLNIALTDPTTVACSKNNSTGIPINPT